MHYDAVQGKPVWNVSSKSLSYWQQQDILALNQKLTAAASLRGRRRTEWDVNPDGTPTAPWTDAAVPAGAAIRGKVDWYNENTKAVLLPAQEIQKLAGEAVTPGGSSQVILMSSVADWNQLTSQQRASVVVHGYQAWAVLGTQLMSLSAMAPEGIVEPTWLRGRLPTRAVPKDAPPLPRSPESWSEFIDTPDSLATSGLRGNLPIGRSSRPIFESADTAVMTRIEAMALDAADHGHSIARHGPELTIQELQIRLATGFTAETPPKFSPAPRSTQFIDYETWLAARQKAVQAFESDPGFTPFPGPQDQTRFNGTFDLGGRIVGAGFEPRPGFSGITTPKPSGSGTFKTFPVADQVPFVTDKFYTNYVFDANLGKWIVVQHFPTK